MSMFDPDARDRALTNHLNEILRHCRIGRVEEKVGQPVRGIPPINIMRTLLPTWPFDTANAPTPTFMDKCGCRVGSACGNAACPHMPIVTCAA